MILNNSTDIITHGDGDGIISAAISKKAGANGNIIITQPFLLDKQKDLINDTIITDIALNNKNPKTVLEWIDRNKNKINMMIDHHIGGDEIKEILGDKYHYDSTAPSCPEFMKRIGFEFPDEWLNAANACDRPTDFKPTNLSKRYNEAFKVALVNLQSGNKSDVDNIQRAFIEELISGNDNNLINQRIKEYPNLINSTKKAAEGYKILSSGAVYTKAGKQNKIDVTALLMEGYKKSDTAIVQVESANDGSDITIVATSDKNKNLVEKFGLKSGAPFRIVLSEGNHDEQLQQIINTLNK